MYTPAATAAVIEVYDLAGKKVSGKKILLNSGEQFIPVNVLALPKGNYVVRVNMNGAVFSRLVSKM